MIKDYREVGEFVEFNIKWYHEEHPKVKSDPDFPQLSIQRGGGARIYNTKVWGWLNTPVLMIFTDSKATLREVTDSLQDMLALRTERLSLGHDVLKGLATAPNVSNVYEVEFRDPSRQSGVNSVTLNGDLIHRSDVFLQLAERGAKLARVMFELGLSGSTFVVTLDTSGFILLSPYVTEPQVRAFANMLVGRLSEGESHA